MQADSIKGDMKNRSRDLALKHLSHFGQLPVKGGLPFEWSAVASNHVAMLGIVQLQLRSCDVVCLDHKHNKSI